MFKVLVHHHGAPANAPFHSKSLLHLLLQLLSQPWLLSFLLATLAIPPVAAAAQGVIIAQAANDGLSVIDSPAVNSVLHAGSNASIAIDVSAGNSGSFSYQSLEIYLVSATTGKNITISNGSQLLTQEPDSTVKHINWPVATCLQEGEYNLTVYEASTLTSNGTGYFAIMPVPVQVQNNGDDDSDSACTSALNVLQAQPQASSPPPIDLIPGRVPSNSTVVPSGTATNSATTTATPKPTGGQVITVTAGDGEITIPLTNLPGTIVVEPSGGAPPDPTSTDMSSGFTTVFKTVAPTATVTEIISQPVTVTFEETFVSTITGPGQTEEFTVTQTQTLISTVELIQTQVSSPEQAGLLPVNAGMMVASPLSAFTMLSTLSVSAFLYILRPASVL